MHFKGKGDMKPEEGLVKEALGGRRWGHCFGINAGSL